MENPVSIRQGRAESTRERFPYWRALAIYKNYIITSNQLGWIWPDRHHQGDEQLRIPQLWFSTGLLAGNIPKVSVLHATRSHGSIILPRVKARDRRHPSGVHASTATNSQEKQPMPNERINPTQASFNGERHTRARQCDDNSNQGAAQRQQTDKSHKSIGDSADARLTRLVVNRPSFVGSGGGGLERQLLHCSQQPKRQSKD